MLKMEKNKGENINKKNNMNNNKIQKLSFLTYDGVVIYFVRMTHVLHRISQVFSFLFGQHMFLFPTSWGGISNDIWFYSRIPLLHNVGFLQDFCKREVL